MHEEIIFAGFGGQGIMLMGKLLASAALKEGRQVTWVPSYGAEVRGGTAHCMVKISDKDIASPYVSHPDTLIAMNQPSLDKLKSRIKNKGLLIINSSLAKSIKRKGIKIFSFPFTDIAINLGNIKVANVIALGTYLAAKKNIKPESILSVMEEMAPKNKQNLLEINQRALQEGMRLVK